MKTVILDEFIYPFKDAHEFMHGIYHGETLQYYGGNTGILSRWTTHLYRRLHCEIVSVDTTTRNHFSLQHNPHLKA